MSVPPMGVCLLSVLSLCAVAVLAVAPCDQKIINMLKTKSSCYKKGVAPKQKDSATRRTYTATTEADLPSNTKCVSTYQNGDMSYVNVFLQDGVQFTIANTRNLKKDHITETDSTKVKHKLYVIHNEDNVFSFYRCAYSSKDKKSPPLVNIAVDCNFVKDPQAQAAVAKSKACFKELGIEAPRDLTP